MVSRPDPSPRNQGKAALLALAVASGEAVRPAAVRLAIPYRTAKRWSASPRFKARVEQLRAEFTDQALGKLTALASEAVEEIGRLMRESSTDAVKLAACKAVLDKLPSLHEYFGINDRIRQIEERLDQGTRR